MDNWAGGGKMLRAGEVCDYDYVLAARSCLVTVMSSLFSLHVCFYAFGLIHNGSGVVSATFFNPQP